MINDFFSFQRNFEVTLYTTYVVKVFLAGRTILGRIDWTIRKLPKMLLKVERPLADAPKAYELRIILDDEIIYLAPTSDDDVEQKMMNCIWCATCLFFIVFPVIIFSKFF